MQPAMLCNRFLRTVFQNTFAIHISSKRVFRTQCVLKQQISLAGRIVELSPNKWQPYMKLMRIDRPIGSWLLFWPCGWSISSAAAAGCMPDPYMLFLFGSGAFLMRGAGCTINDMWDRDLDAQVERTRHRPLVNGMLTMRQAWFFLGAQLSLSLAILLQMNWNTVMLGASSLVLVGTYPLMKRITHWPQFVLGCTFNWGALLGYSAIHGSVNWTVCGPLYLAGICWTIIYDTIYAHQDRLADIRLGLKSTAIRFNTATQHWLNAFSVIMISNLMISGLMNEQTWPYFVGVCIAGYHVLSQIQNLQIDNPTKCGQQFVSNRHVGAIVFIGIILGTLLKKRREDQTVESNQLCEKMENDNVC